MRKDLQTARIEKLFGSLKGVDALFIINTNKIDPTFRYLTGFTSGVFDDAIVIATRKKMFLIISPVDYQNAMLHRPASMEVIDNRYGDGITERWLKKLIEGKTVGINAHFMPVMLYENVKKAYSPKRMVDVSRQLLDARRIKVRELLF
jgi:Xaa-Pro aminopeptidase